MIGLGLGINQIRRSSASGPDRAALITALYGAGEQGAFYDPSDLTTLFQDSAGTTPVTADGQPVGYMADLSGNGNHATQATAARRPLYKTDGTLHWIQFDGFDDRLVVPDSKSIFNFMHNGGPSGVIVGMRPLGGAGTFRIFVDNGNLGVDTGASLTIRSNNAMDVAVADAGTNRLAHASSGIDTTVGTDDVIDWALDSAASPDSRLRSSGASHTANASGAYPTANATYDLNIGQRASNVLHFNGRIYRLIIAETAATDDARSFVASKSGVTL